MSFPQFGDLDMLNSHSSQSNTFSSNCSFRLQKVLGSQSTECVSFPATGKAALTHTSFPSPMVLPWMSQLPPSSQLPFLKLGNYFSHKSMQEIQI